MMMSEGRQLSNRQIKGSDNSRRHPAWGFQSLSAPFENVPSQNWKGCFGSLHCVFQTLDTVTLFRWHVQTEVVLEWTWKTPPPPLTMSYFVDKPLSSPLACVVSTACTGNIISTLNSVCSRLHSFVSMKGVRSDPANWQKSYTNHKPIIVDLKA